jgi:hypothetical protein
MAVSDKMGAGNQLIRLFKSNTVFGGEKKFHAEISDYEL